MCLGSHKLKATSTSGVVAETAISPTDHEEANTRMFVHCKHSSEQGFTNVLIHTVDSDVMMIEIHLFNEQHYETLWICFENALPVMRYWAFWIKNFLAGLTFFHDFTGEDTVSAYQRHGKKTAWEIWLVTNDISNTFARLSIPSNIIYDDGKKLESFVIKMYNKTINAPPPLWITQGDGFRERLPSRTTSTKANISCPEISYRRSIVPCRTCPRYGHHLYPHTLLNNPTNVRYCLVSFM